MARRFSAPYQTEPVSGLATWSRNLAVFSVITVLVAVVIVHTDFLEIKPAMATFFGGLAVAGLSILLAIAAFASIWQNGSRGMGRILLALLIDAMVLAYPAYLGLQYRKLPNIHDITPTRSIRRASRRWRACAPATAPIPRSMRASIRPSSSASPIPISRPWSSSCRRSAPMR